MDPTSEKARLSLEIQPIKENPKEEREEEREKKGGNLKSPLLFLKIEADWRRTELPRSRGELKSSHLLASPPDPTTENASNPF